MGWNDTGMGLLFFSGHANSEVDELTFNNIYKIFFVGTLDL